MDDCGDNEIKLAETFETQVQDAAPPRKVNFQKKHKDKGGKKVPEGKSVLPDVENAASTTKSEQVLLLLGEQIAKLEKTIKMMKPGGVTKRERSQNSFHIHDYAVQNIETVIRDMKRSFSKVFAIFRSRRCLEIHLIFRFNRWTVNGRSGVEVRVRIENQSRNEANYHLGPELRMVPSPWRPSSTKTRYAELRIIQAAKSARMTLCKVRRT